MPVFTGKIFLILGLVLAGLLALALLLWAVCVRRYVRQCGGRTAPLHSLAAPLADFGTCLVYRRGPLPWHVQFYAVVLILIGADMALALVLLLFGNVFGI
jgi:hypothetical protein